MGQVKKIAVPAAASREITGTIAASQMVGGTGKDTIGPITDGLGTWQWGIDTGVDLTCETDPGCEIALYDSTGYVLLNPSSISVVSGPNYTNAVMNPNYLEFTGGGASCVMQGANNVSEICSPYMTVDQAGNLNAKTYSAGGAAGVTVSGSSCTITAIKAGIITAATCLP